ncbi:unnamed protein product [Protopolystoma xenopodis]|uniref:Uncharacterized protein n=1 Tax=Protopolystoma xenopodis TaxID=117903 RepID=A0A448XJ83_9PLAT|nr:unnamed protein product [Protopolystoma xenopodis]
MLEAIACYQSGTAVKVVLFSCAAGVQLTEGTRLSCMCLCSLHVPALRSKSLSFLGTTGIGLIYRPQPDWRLSRLSESEFVSSIGFVEMEVVGLQADPLKGQGSKLNRIQMCL